MPIKIAIVISHPIQHFCPQYASFAQHKDAVCKVFFASALGYKKYVDVNFKQEIAWGNLRLESFDHEFLNGEEILPSDADLDAPGLDGALTNFKPGLVIVYGYFQKYQRRAYRWARKNKVPIAYISDSELRQKRSRLKQWLKYFYLKSYFSGIDFFLTVGNANESFYRKYGVPEEKLLRMHFPIDVESYREAFAQRTALRRKIRVQYNIADHEYVLCVVGKLVSWKSQDHIIDALSLLEKENLNAHLFILGSGEKLDEWKHKARKLTISKVHFPGFVTIEELPAYYAATDLYVHPAMIEPHSIAISEAIYMGCPVIISDRCGSYGESDDVQEGRNGLVYAFGSIDQLAHCINQLLVDAERRKRFAVYSRQIATAFQQQSHCIILDQLIERLN